MVGRNCPFPENDFLISKLHILEDSKVLNFIKKITPLQGCHV